MEETWIFVVRIWHVFNATVFHINAIHFYNFVIFSFSPTQFLSTSRSSPSQNRQHATNRALTWNRRCRASTLSATSSSSANRYWLHPYRSSSRQPQTAQEFVVVKRPQHSRVYRPLDSLHPLVCHISPLLTGHANNSCSILSRVRLPTPSRPPPRHCQYHSTRPPRLCPLWIWISIMWWSRRMCREVCLRAVKEVPLLAVRGARSNSPRISRLTSSRGSRICTHTSWKKSKF